MGGRELRATLVFVVASLVVGFAYREWRARATGGVNGPTFIERLRAMEEGDALDRERGLDADELASGVPAGAGDPSDEPRSDAALTGDTASRGHASRGPRAARDRPPPLGALDVDRAAEADWERLPGIGPALAARIVADRAAHGPFRSPEGLLRVRGIGPKTLDRLRPFLRKAVVDSLSPFAK